MHRINAAKRRCSPEAGMSLVEVLASIVILTIFISIVFMVFIQTAETANTTESTIDATYLAQSEMEKVYLASRQQTLLNWRKDLPNHGWLQSETDTAIYTKQAIEPGFSLKLEVSPNHNGYTHILVYVYQDGFKNPKAQMENFYLWKDETE